MKEQMKNGKLNNGSRKYRQDRVLGNMHRSFFFN